jgi:5-methylcytosine-specific restriction endonuclease McrA
MAERYEKRKAAAISALGGQCVECGSTENFQFDHIDPSTKSFTIAAKLAGIAEQRLQEELQKCQLLCLPCHVKKTVAETDYVVRSWNRVENPEHGTSVMYFREKCRCHKCREWRRLRRKGLVNNDGSLR